MNCQDCGERIDEYLEETLDTAVRREVEAHAAACGACRAELAEARQLAARVKALPRHEPGADVVLRVSARILGAAAAPVRRTEFGPVLDAGELAEFLRVDEETLDAYLEDIPRFELGGKLLFRRKAVEDWITRREMSFVLQAGETCSSRRALEGAAAQGGATWTISGRN